MANIANPSEVVGIYSPVMIPRDYKDFVELPPSDYTITPVTVTSASASLVTFQQNNIPCSTYLDRFIEFEFVANISVHSQLAINGGANPITNPLFLNDIICMRALPMVSNSPSVRIKINSQSQSYSSNLWYDAISRFTGDKYVEEKSMYLTECPLAHDYGAYSVFGIPANPPPVAAPSIYGIIDNTCYNPFGYNQSPLYSARTQFLVSAAVSVGDNVNGWDTVLTYRWKEVMSLAPLVDKHNLEGIYDIRSIQIDFSTPPPDKFLCINRSLAINGALLENFAINGVVFDQAQTKMYLRTTTPSIGLNCLDSDKLIRCKGVLPSLDFAETVTPAGNANPGQEVNGISSSAVSWTKVPSRIYVFLCRAGEVFGPRDANIYPLIRKISVSYGNKSNICSDWDVYQIYDRLVRGKGYNIPWIQYSTAAGSVICLTPSDFNIPDFVAGAPCCSSFQIKVDFTNLYNLDPQGAGAATNLALKVVAVFDGVFNYNNTTANWGELVVDAASVMLEAENQYKQLQCIEFKDLCGKTPADKLVAGSIKDDVINAVSNVYNKGKQAVNWYLDNREWIDEYISQAIDVGQTVAEIVTDLLGAGAGSRKFGNTKKIAAGLQPARDILPPLARYFGTATAQRAISNYEAGCMACSGGAVVKRSADFSKKNAKKTLRNRY